LRTPHALGFASLSKKQSGNIKIPTNTGDTREYSRYARVRFSVDGNEGELTVFKGGKNLFLPFADATNGESSYAAGRYVEVQERDGHFVIDFNEAYSPYCAYSDRFSCPRVPRENKLPFNVEAGERIAK
jgi:uncharacterized protein (DUF1684 family)